MGGIDKWVVYNRWCDINGLCDVDVNDIYTKTLTDIQTYTHKHIHVYRHFSFWREKKRKKRKKKKEIPLIREYILHELLACCTTRVCYVLILPDNTR